MKPQATKFVILYAEDDEDDLYLVQECFTHYSDLIEIVHASNGSEALRALELLHHKNIQPCLIFLDINMPIMDGRQALTQIKRKKEYEPIPVVLFTTSSSELDRYFARKWGADFITKPLQVKNIEALAQEFAKGAGKIY